jgi:RNHCP domain
VRRSPKKQTRFAEESDDFSFDSKANSKRRPKYARQEVFKCRHCHQFVGPLPSGGSQRNHCPFCLFSRHVDDHIGDRMSSCGASMEAIGYFQRPNGEYVIVHRCFACGLERFNRIAADDNFELVLSLPVLPPRTSREVKAQRLEEEVGTELDIDQIA